MFKFSSMQKDYMCFENDTFFEYSTIGGIIIATNGIFARNALKIATGTVNFKRTHTILSFVFQIL
jgi:hypothetical protein